MKIQEFLSFLVISICVVAGLCVEDDEQSLLLQLKNSLTFNSESSSKLKMWNQSVACCNWSGVTCNDEGYVIGLDLSEESITGGFDNKSSLFSLQHLQSLSLGYNNFNSVIPSTFNRLKNLTYLSLSYAGFVGQIPIEISQLTGLVTLDISSLSYLTGEELKLENPNLGMLVRNLSSIQQLYLDGVTMTSQGEEWCNSLLFLPNLQELSMSSCNLSGPIDASLANLVNLSVIILNQNNLSSTVPETFANLKNLTTLGLSSCGLIGTFPQKIFQVRTLSSIDISYNSNLQGFFPSFQLSGALHTLIVKETSFSGTLPSSLSNLKGLSYLDLSFNNFTGPIPSFGMARKLSYIDLCHNNFSGPIPSSAHFEGLQNLSSINLGYNSISGRIPSSLFRLPLLQKIQLSNNQFGQLDELKNVSSSKLMILDLSSNNISGPIPTSLFQLTGLSILQLSFNNFKGLMQLNKFLELRNLITLDLSYNNLSVNVNINLSSIANISTLNLASCSLKVIPGFLRYQSVLTTLDLSDNQIQGSVPNWIWKLEYLDSLNMSHNFLTDFEGPLQNLSSNLAVLDLHYNQLRGPTPVFPKSALYIDYSNNNFSSIIPVKIGGYLFRPIYLSLANNRFRGSIPDSICDVFNPQVLDLSHNHISGTIPSCLMTLSHMLDVLDLRNNKLSGSIPDLFPTSCALRTLDLHGNILEGHFPKPVGNCSTLELLDLGNNQITDGFPCSLKNISTLRVLVLRDNNFHGNIGCPKTSDTWKMLQIVDLAFNKFNGALPGKWFRTWEAMMHDEDKADSGVNHLQFEVLKFGPKYYQDSVTVTSKGLTMELVKILTVFTSIDFSSTHFQGEIPKELFDFKALYVLNLSNNALSGQIPSSIGNLKQLESLDLSNNSLEGEIPTELASLNFLSVLNLSFNQLQGRIPTGTQIQSFLNTSFVGNKGLCGPPLTANCRATHDTFSSVGQQDSAIDWNFISVEVGFIFGLAVVIGPILFCKKWKLKYWQYLDRVLCWIFPQLSLEYERHGGQSYKVLVWRRY